jgi:hypothetical protein
MTNTTHKKHTTNYLLVFTKKTTLLILKYAQSANT